MALKQSLRQKQLLKMSPQQIQLMKLIQVPAMLMEQRVKEEIEENPALEEGPENADDLDELVLPENTPESPKDITPEDSSSEEDGTNEEMEVQDSSDFEDSFELSEYYDDDDDGVAEYKMRDPAELNGLSDDRGFVPRAAGHSFQDLLDEQVALLDVTERESAIAYHLVGSLDEDGYLRRDWDALCDDLLFSQNIKTDSAELKRLLSLIQKFDPPGVGALSLQQCLLLQLDRKESNPIIRMARRMLLEYFDAFSRKHYEKIKEGLALDEEEFRIVLQEITSLNPRPGAALSAKTEVTQYVIPDFIVTHSNGELQLSLHQTNMPELRVSQHFKDMLKEYKRRKGKKQELRDALVFIKQKMDSARWFMDALKQRQETLLGTMQIIMDIQHAYFLSGAESSLKPMILKDVAEKTGLDVSTISRVVNSKYVQTEWGTLPLKFFFSEGIKSDQGEDISTREVKNILAELIAQEDKKRPMSDEELMDALKLKGFAIARRTVAKYREQLGLPVGRMRKSL